MTASGEQSVSELGGLLGRPVHVTLASGVSVYGTLYTVDSVSGSAALLQFIPGKGAETFQIIPGESISKLELATDPVPNVCAPVTPEMSAWLGGLFKQHSTGGSSDQLIQERKRKLIDWMKRNHVPVRQTDDGTLHIFESVKILAPFGVDDCVCSNEMVLGKVRQLIEALPKE